MEVLIAGESWVTYSVHMKGFSSFTTGEYETGLESLVMALRTDDIEVAHIANHVASKDFPTQASELSRFNVIVLSDIGADTLQLHPEAFLHGKRAPDRLQLINGY